MSKHQVIALDKNWFKDAREPAKSIEIKKKVKLSNEYYSVAQVAKRFSVSSDRIYDFIRSGRLEAVVLGRGYRISREALEAFLEESAARKKRAG